MKFLTTLSLILSRVAVLQVIWQKWDIRTFLIASFTLQLFLILAAPIRKRSSNWITRASLWASYLLADWVAAQAIGLIIRATERGCQSVSDAQGYLFSFWAQFLLIHLGGPDPITALALEDNELWLRTTLHLGTQTYGTLGVLFRSTRSSGLWAATVLMFLTGTIKYLERVMSLFHGRLMDGLDENPRHYAEQLMENHSDDGRLGDTDMEVQSKRDDRLTNVEMVRDAFSLFHCHKRLFADRQLSSKVRKSTQVYFMRRTPEEAYKLLEIELNFTYEAIYTKMKVIQKPAWKILRHIVLSLEVVGLVIWWLADKKGYPDYDIRITYALVVGAIAVDVLAFLRIQLSDWNIAISGKGCWRNWRMELYNKLLAARTRNWKESVLVEADSSSPILLLIRSWFRRVFLIRWVESIHQTDEKYDPDELKSCKTLYRVAEHFNLQWYWFRQFLVYKKGVSSEMWDLIYEVVRKDKSSSGLERKRYKRVANGEEEEVDIHSLVDAAFPTLSLEDKDFFLGCDSWYSLTFKLYKEKERAREESKVEQTAKLISLRQDISFALWRYLSYLLVFQTDMMYGATGKERILSELDPIFGHETISSDDDDNKEDRPQGVKGIVDLNKFLDEIEYENEHENEREILKWELVARVWVKILCYSAIKCRPDVHARKLKEGGELLSFVWLLMVNLGVTKV